MWGGCLGRPVYMASETPTLQVVVIYFLEFPKLDRTPFFQTVAPSDRASGFGTDQYNLLYQKVLRLFEN